MIDEPPDEPHVALYEGVVVDNADPELRGRVTVRIPGLVEPESGWADPVGSAGGGITAQGFFFPPKVGANIVVWFKHGDVDHPRYAVGSWARGEAPSFLAGLTPQQATMVKGIQTDRWEIVFDDRDGQALLRITDRAFPLDIVEIDGLKHGITISGTVAVVIKSLGIVSVEALQIVLNGRLVKPGTDPI